MRNSKEERIKDGELDRRMGSSWVIRQENGEQKENQIGEHVKYGELQQMGEWVTDGELDRGMGSGTEVRRRIDSGLVLFL